MIQGVSQTSPDLVAIQIEAAMRAECTEPHWRRTEKTSFSLAGLTAADATISQVLTPSAVPAIYAGPSFKCIDHAGRELRNYYIYVAGAAPDRATSSHAVF